MGFTHRYCRYSNLKSPARWLILLHPILTTIVVVITANHFWLDIIVGAILAYGGWLIGVKYWPIKTFSRDREELHQKVVEESVLIEPISE